VHAIQCKLYAADYRCRRADIDSFFTASGKKPFTHRIIVSTTDLWSEHAEAALRDQQPPVTKIDLTALESQPDRLVQATSPRSRPLPSRRRRRLRPHQNASRRCCRACRRSGPRQAHHGLRHGQDLHQPQDRRALAGAGKRVLFLVPSLALLSQT
jgi:predicted helicase